MGSRPYCGNCVAIRFDSIQWLLWTDRLLQVDKTKPGDNFFYVNMPQVQGSALQVHLATLPTQRDPAVPCTTYLGPWAPERSMPREGFAL